MPQFHLKLIKMSPTPRKITSRRILKNKYTGEKDFFDLFKFLGHDKLRWVGDKPHFWLRYKSLSGKEHRRLKKQKKVPVMKKEPQKNMWNGFVFPEIKLPSYNPEDDLIRINSSMKQEYVAAKYGIYADGYFMNLLNADHQKSEDYMLIHLAVGIGVTEKEIKWIN